MSSYLIRNAKILGGAPQDVLIADGVIRQIGTDLAAEADIDIDAHGLVLLPGLVDLHTHLRQPGKEEAETVLTGTRAAAMGGYTAVHAMANTSPVADTAAVVEQVWELGRASGYCDVQPVGAVTVGLEGEELAELAGMHDCAAAVRVFSDDGKCVDDAALMRRALEYVKTIDGVVAQHAQEPRLTEGAQMNEGTVSAELGLPGWPAVAEEAIIARDVLLTDELVRTGDAAYKVNPPLRTEADVHALRAALADGTIDAVATDHAPHPAADKDCAWALAAMGMVGLETALSVVQQTMVDTGLLNWEGVADRMSHRPARIGRLSGHGRPISVGEPANLVLFDPAYRGTVDAESFATRSRNTPYRGLELPGRVHATFLRGVATVLAGELAEQGDLV